MYNVIVTCPPMIGLINEFMEYANSHQINLVPANVTQTLSESELINLIPNFDGWIIGDDVTNRNVIMHATNGKLKAAVKWGIGVDNIDFDSFKEFNLPIENTPMMFGAEVADIALAYVISLARQLFYIDNEIKNNKLWPKPAGISLSNKKIGVVGLGDIGKNLTKRLIACDMEIIGYDPYAIQENFPYVKIKNWPEGLTDLDFLVFTCSLNKQNYHMLNQYTLDMCKDGIFIINVARGPLIDENALINSISNNKVKAVALDVFENEPLESNSILRKNKLNIFGSHNASNTVDAVRKASIISINKIVNQLNVKK